MKRTYINPVMEVIKIASQIQMMAGSPASFDNHGSGSVNLTDDDPDDDYVLQSCIQMVTLTPRGLMGTDPVSPCAQTSRMYCKGCGRPVWDYGGLRTFLYGLV